jgi:spore germination cell wall hydrolase CwlJ-like protein
MLDPYTLVLMAIMVCREAQFEPLQGQLAVAQTVMNRADNPGWWGQDPADIITFPMQYSPMTDPKDPQLTWWPSSRGASLKGCLKVAEDALTRKSPVIVKGADSFYAVTMKKPPTWAMPGTFVAQIGGHIFHNIDGR